MKKQKLYRCTGIENPVSCQLNGTAYADIKNVMNKLLTGITEIIASGARHHSAARFAAGVRQCECPSCGTALSGKERSLRGRLSPNINAIYNNAYNATEDKISKISKTFSLDRLLPKSTRNKYFSSVKSRFPTMKKLVYGAMVLGAMSGVANAENNIELGENSVQGQYSLVDDATTPGLDIECNVTWENLSDYVDANNQISANGSTGTKDGLYKITTEDRTHRRNAPTYTINPESFLIEYASGVVNQPGQDDTFKLHFTLDESLTQAEVQNIVDKLNSYISGTPYDNGDYTKQASINGEVVFDGSDFKPFQNSPTIYTPTKVVDGIPIEWVRAFGITNGFYAALSDDPDLDRFLTAEEYHADTNPTNGQSFLQLSITSSNLYYESSTNCMYGIEWCDSLSSNAWNVLTNDMPGTGGEVSVADTNEVPCRFYRVKAERK